MRSLSLPQASGRGCGVQKELQCLRHLKRGREMRHLGAPVYKFWLLAYEWVRHLFQHVAQKKAAKCIDRCSTGGQKSWTMKALMPQWWKYRINYGLCVLLSASRLGSFKWVVTHDLTSARCTLSGSAVSVLILLHGCWRMLGKVPFVNVNNAPLLFRIRPKTAILFIQIYCLPMHRCLCILC